jgi:SEC-C motif-containing protein
MSACDGYRRGVPEFCPCGSRVPYADCCGRLHNGDAVAGTPEELMRSRYSAFVVGDAGYLLRTWHPRTRPAELHLDPAVEWLSLQVLEATGDEVEFIARYRGPGGRGFQRERSRFVERAGRWLYLDGTTS